VLNGTLFVKYLIIDKILYLQSRFGKQVKC